jgi:hypothetical protein
MMCLFSLCELKSVSVLGSISQDGKPGAEAPSRSGIAERLVRDLPDNVDEASRLVLITGRDGPSTLILCVDGWIPISPRLLDKTPAGLPGR